MFKVLADKIDLRLFSITCISIASAVFGLGFPILNWFYASSMSYSALSLNISAKHFIWFKVTPAVVWRVCTELYWFWDVSMFTSDALWNIFAKSYFKFSVLFH